MAAKSYDSGSRSAKNSTRDRRLEDAEERKRKAVRTFIGKDKKNKK